MSLSYRDAETGGRRFAGLSLERAKIHLFPFNWTVVHPIDETSPLFGMAETDLLNVEAEFIVLIKAFDDTFSQIIYARTSYRGDEVLWGAKFIPMTTAMEDGRTLMEINLIDVTEPSPLPLLTRLSPSPPRQGDDL